MRKSAGLPSYEKDYEQRGFVCTVEIDPLDENKTAFQRFLPGGQVLAMLPCGENQMSIVWSCSNDLAKALQKLEKENLVNAINKGFSRQYERGFLDDIHSVLR